MKKQYTSYIRNVSPRPRSKRLRELGGGVVSASAGGSGAQVSGDGHSHANKGLLDSLALDGEGYLSTTAVDDEGNTVYAPYLQKSIFDDLFEKVAVSEGRYAIRAKYDLYSDGDITALGRVASSGGGDGSGGTGVAGMYYGDWTDYSEGYDSYAVSGKSGKALYDLIAKGGGVDASQLGSLTITRNGVTAGVYSPSKASTIDITVPTRLSQLVDDCGYLGRSEADSLYLKVSDLIRSYPYTQGTIANVRADGVMEVGKYIDFHDGSGDTSDYNPRLKAQGGALYINDSRILTEGNYASSLDGRYVKKSGDTMSGRLTITGASGSGSGLVTDEINTNNSNGLLTYHPASWTGVTAQQWSVGTVDSQGVIRSGNASLLHYRHGSATLSTIWDSGNDGAGSGLDADLLDGRHAEGFSWRKYLGTQQDTHGAYVILSHAYDGAILNGSFFMGTVYITRGNSGAYNAKTAVMVQCGGQYNSNITAYQILTGSVPISGLYKIAYNGTAYIALKIGATSTMEFLVEGWWRGFDPIVVDGASTAVTSETLLTNTPTMVANTSSATKLQTARKLWGQSFDGTADVSGDMSGVGNILPAVNFTYSIGSSTNEFKEADIRQVFARHLDGGRAFNGGKSQELYIQYNSKANTYLNPNGGNVAVGKATADYKLDVNGTARVTALLISSGLVEWDAAKNAFKFNGNLYATGDITALGSSAVGGSGSSGGVDTLAQLADVTLSGLSAGHALVWDGTKWVNRSVASAGLDLSGLAQYLSSNQYLTQPVADGRYVTLATEQTISGKKTFSSLLTLGSRGAGIPASTVDRNLLTLHPVSHTGGPWHINTQDTTDTAFLRILYGTVEKFKFSTTGSLTASAFVKAGGTSSQFLMADGSVTTKKVRNTTGTLDWTNTVNGDVTIPTISLLAYWNGCYTGTGSNLQYCDRGRFGDIVTHSHSEYVTALGASGNYLTWTKNGVVNNITVPYATNADTVDGLHETNFARALYAGNVLGGDMNDMLSSRTFLGSINASANTPAGNGWYNVVQVAHRNGHGDGPSYVGQIALGMTVTHDNMYFRTHRTRTWQRVLTNNNYTSVLDSRYVKKSGDTMSGTLRVPEIAGLEEYSSMLSYHPAAWSGVTAQQWGLGAATAQGVIRSTDASLLHYRHGSATLSTIWDSGNDGSGSGLDADLLDGVHLADVSSCWKWSFTPYVYDATNGLRYYWHKIATIPEGDNSHDVLLEYFAKGDFNYPENLLHGYLSISTYAGGINVVLTLDPTDGSATVQAIISGRDVWVRFYGIAWSSYAIMRSMHNNGIAISNSVKQEAQPSGVVVNPNQGAKNGAVTHSSLTYQNVNASSATRLRDTFTLWGQSFYGNNVSGTLSNATGIDFETAQAGRYRFKGTAYIGKWTNGTATITAENGYAYFGCDYPDKPNSVIAISGVSGNVGVGKATADYKLDVNGTARVASIIIGSIGVSHDTAAGGLKVAGNAYATGDLTALGTLSQSDMRLKNVVRGFVLDINSIANAPLFIHTWKNREPVEYAGTSAQFWQVVLPQVVRGTDCLALDYGKAALASVISVAKETVSIKEEIRKLRKRVMELESINNIIHQP